MTTQSPLPLSEDKTRRHQHSSFMQQHLFMVKTHDIFMSEVAFGQNIMDQDMY